MRTLPLVVVLLTGLGCSKHDDASVTAVKTETAEAPAITEAQYAAKLLAELKKHGGKPALAYDADKHRISDGEMNISVTNVYAEYIKLPEADRELALAHVVATFAGIDQAPDEKLDSVRAKLLPAVRAGMYFDWDLQSPAKADKVKMQHHAVFVALGENTRTGVAIDQESSMQIATDKQLDAWGLTIEQALAIATTNLATKGTPFELVQPGLWTSPAHDNYDSSRLLLLEEIKKLGIKGTVVAVIPNRDTLYLAGAQDAKALLAMAELADKAAEDPRPIHTVPLCLAGQTWSDCEPGPTPEVKQRMHTLATAGLQSLYDEQHDALQEAVGEDVFVAKLTVYETKKTKRRTSFATWTRSVPTLLPRADQISFVEINGDKPEDAKVLGMVPWDRAMSVLGSHLKPTGRSPQRWATGDYFPTKAELAKLAPTMEGLGD